jgi:hypothetical protein
MERQSARPAVEFQNPTQKRGIAEKNQVGNRSPALFCVSAVLRWVFILLPRKNLL